MDLEQIRVSALNLTVGDSFIFGATITSVKAYTLAGYNVDYIRTTDNARSRATHWPANTLLTILRAKK
jgi:hypothetical protein